jgi:hypothetical protein
MMIEFGAPEGVSMEVFFNRRRVLQQMHRKLRASCAPCDKDGDYFLSISK